MDDGSYFAWLFTVIWKTNWKSTNTKTSLFKQRRIHTSPSSKGKFLITVIGEKEDEHKSSTINKLAAHQQSTT